MKKRSRFRRLLLAGFFLVAVTPLLAFGISNLYLISPKGRAFIASKISRQLQLEASIQGGSWSPWNGVSIYGIRIEQPASLKAAVSSPLLAVESIRISPVWSQVIRKRQMLIKRMDLRKPKLTIPVELLSQIPSRQPEPEIAANRPPQPVIPDPQPIPDQNGQAAETTQASAKEIPAPLPQKPVTSIESLNQSKLPTVWVNFSEARVRIVSARSKSTLFEVSEINGGLPLGGKSAKSEVSLKGIRCLESETVSEMTIPVKWRTPFLHIGEIDGSPLGIDCRVGASIGLSAGMPFQINSVLPEQKEKELHIGEMLEAKLGSIVGQGILQGQFLAPATWQGQWALRSAAIDVSYSEQKGHFEEGHALVVFRNGALSCIDARLVGESLSILGNATLLSDGRAAANARIIAPPETLVAVSKFTEPQSAAPVLTPLSTPQRSALDLSVFGNLGKLYYKPNPRATAIPIH